MSSTAASQSEMARAPAAPVVAPGPNASIVELTTQSTHDAVVALKDDFPTLIEDPDHTFGNFNEKEAKKAYHQGCQVITLTAAAGGPVESLTEIAKKRAAKEKFYASILRGVNGAERRAVNETRYTPIGQAPAATRGPGIIDRLLRRTGARPQQ